MAPVSGNPDVRPASGFAYGYAVTSGVIGYAVTGPAQHMRDASIGRATRCALTRSVVWICVHLRDLRFLWLLVG